MKQWMLSLTNYMHYATWPSLAPKIMDYTKRICPDYNKTLEIVDMIEKEDGDALDKELSQGKS